MREIDQQLFQAVAERKVQKIKEALKNGADINAVDEKGKTPLIKATDCSFVNIDVIDALCTGKTNLNAQDNEGYTALMYAALNGVSLTVQKLLDLGADANITNKQGDTAHGLAKREGFYCVYNYLEDFEKNKKLAEAIIDSARPLMNERLQLMKAIKQLEAKNAILMQKNKDLQKEVRRLRAQKANAVKSRQIKAGRYKIMGQSSKSTARRRGKTRVHD